MDTIDKWFSQYAKGKRSSLEMLSLLYSYVTEHPDESDSVVNALQNHADPNLQCLASDLSELIRGKSGQHNDGTPPVMPRQ